MIDNNRYCYIVTGLPRSGTSATAGVLHHLGIPMLRDSSVRKDRYNKNGYYENLHVINKNVMITGTRTFSQMIKAINNVNLGHKYDVDISLYERPILGMMKDNTIFGFKDPRFCFPDLLVTFIYKLYEYIPRSNIRIFLTYRNPKSIASSLLTLTDLDIEKRELEESLYQFYRRTFNMVRKTELDYHVVSYESLINNTNATVNRLARHCNVPVTQSAISFIDKSLQRH